MKNFLKVLIPSALFLLTFFVVGTNLNKPFWGTHDWNGARYGNIAKNYLRYGPIGTKFGQVENGGVSAPAQFIYYTHYQPLLPLLIAGSYKIFGVSEYATRLLPLIATAGFVIVIYFIGWELVSWQSGLFSSLLALATPMLRYYGKNPVHEPLALFFASLAFLGLIKKNKWLLLTGVILTALTNWSFVFLVAGISIFLLSKKNLKQIFSLWTLAFVLAALHFLHIKILTGSFLGGNLIGALLERTSVDQVVAKFGIVQYILQIRLWSSTLFTNTLLAFALIGALIMIKSKFGRFKKFILAVLIYCLYPIFFANASFVHSYFIYYLVFPLALLAGYFCAKMIEFKKILLVLALGIIIGVWLERNDYVGALNESSGDRLAVQASVVIRAKTKPTDTVLVEPPDYELSRLPILSYYSERNIIASGRADWTVIVSGDKYEITKTKIQ